MGPLKLYDSMINQSILKPNAYQKSTVLILQQLFNSLISKKNISTSESKFLLFNVPNFASLFKNKVNPNEISTKKGIYLWGESGTGKTMLMDLFYKSLKEYPTLNQNQVERIHYDQFMSKVHREVHELRSKGINQDFISHMAKHWRLQILCLDEFQVTDIKDAMILKSILEHFIKKDVFIITTSNRHPSELYKHGIQRETFLPVIELLKNNLLIRPLNGDDYRKSDSQSKAFYFPLNDSTNQTINELWKHLIKSNPVLPTHISHYGRAITLEETCPETRALKISFQDICSKSLAPVDYIKISQLFNTVIITSIPQLSIDMRDETRRFITLIDALYDSKVNLIISCQVPLDSLFETDIEASLDEEVFSFKRTLSRLNEMTRIPLSNQSIQHDKSNQ